MLQIRRKDTGEILEVRKYVRSGGEKPEEHVWCDAWYGRHVIGVDCDWVPPTTQEPYEIGFKNGRKIRIDQRIAKNLIKRFVEAGAHDNQKRHFSRDEVSLFALDMRELMYVKLIG